MNHIYRSIWSEALGVWIAVSEHSKAHGKRVSASRKLLATGLLVCSVPAWALPMGNELVAGQASVSSSNAGQMQIQQNSQQAIINWQGFSIAPNEAVTIQQPNAQAALLNRVLGQDASQIQGQLNANGQVYLVNPNGVIFSKTAQVDVGGLVASTHNITNADFMNGNQHFTQDGATGAVENHGTINTPEGGVVALIGESVTNTGNINTPKGTTALAAGKTVDLDFQGNGLVEVKVSEAALNAQIKNQGAIQADGGRVILTAKAAGQLIDTVINQQGVVRAQSLVARNGEIILDGGNSGIVQVSGILDVDAKANNSTGGKIGVTGDQIHVQNGAILSASGDAGGGTIVIGDKQTTSQTTIEQGASISAQTQDHGTAGTIDVFANMNNGTLNVAGKLDASAPNNGNGGFIETSAAHVKIADSAIVTTKANTGTSGGWLIDPADFTIAAAGGDITGLALSANLALSPVTILSSNGVAGANGDVNVNDVVNWSANLLTLNAQRNININASLNGSGTAQLALEYGQGTVASGNTSTYIIGAGTAVNLPAGNNFSTKLGSDGVVKNYTVITSLGAAGVFNTKTDLQGMDLVLNYALGADINAAPASTWNTGEGFMSIGSSSTNAFNGSFDGLGHTINNLSINRPLVDNVGLFGWLGANGSIANVGLIGGSVTGRNVVGSLLGGNTNGASINNAYATGTLMVTGTNNVGGLVGSNYANIANSYATDLVNGQTTVGGLVGFNSNGSISAHITNSYATGNVNGTSQVGGLIGLNEGFLADSYATGNITGSQELGGLTGLNNGRASNSHYNADVTLINGSPLLTVGGLYGLQYQDWMMNGKTLNIANYASTLPLGLGGYYFINDLQGMKDLLGFADNPSYKFHLNANLDLASAPGFFIPYLATEFDGANNSIANLKINQPFNSNMAMFGQSSASNGSIPYIKNLKLINVDVTGRNMVGGLAGNFSGFDNTISNSSATGKVTGNDLVGGLVGFVGYSNSGVNSVSDSHAAVDVVGNNSVGGLVGDITGGNIFNSYATGQVTANNTNGGGLVGVNLGTITSSFASGKVTGVSTTGGLVGDNRGSIDKSYATGDVIGYSTVGGLVGNNSSSINNAYATGSVNGTNGVAGLVSLNSGTINNTYAAGSVVGSGLVDNNSGTISNSFWDTQTTGQATVGVATSSGTMTAVTGLGTTDLMKQITYSGVGWDFSNIWWINEGSTRPLLRSLYSTTITNISQLQMMSMDLSASYTLGDNIDATSTSTWNLGAGFNPIGNSSTPFLGSFNGLGYTINGLFINRPDTDFVGLFGYTGVTSSIQNVGLFGGSITGKTNVGALIGYNNGLINNAYSTSDVLGSQFTGGLVGYNTSSINNVYASGTVKANNGSEIGGLVGGNYGGTINNAYATGAVTVTGSAVDVGGLVGQSGSGRISNTYASGNVTTDPTASFWVGALVGCDTGGTVENSFWDTQTSNQSVGIGFNDLGGAIGTTAEMKQTTTFSNAGWNISNSGGSSAIWRIYEGNTAPLLRSFLTPLTAYSDGTYSPASVNLAHVRDLGAGLFSDQQGYDISQVIVTPFATPFATPPIISPVTPPDVFPIISPVTPPDVFPIISPVTPPDVLPVISPVTPPDVLPVISPVSPPEVLPIISSVTPPEVLPIISSVTPPDVLPIISSVTPPDVLPVISPIRQNATTDLNFSVSQIVPLQASTTFLNGYIPELQARKFDLDESDNTPDSDFSVNDSNDSFSGGSSNPLTRFIDGFSGGSTSDSFSGSSSNPFTRFITELVEDKKPIHPVLQIKNSAGQVKRLRMSRDRQFLSLLMEDGSVRIWDLQSGMQRQINPQNEKQTLTDITTVDDKGEALSIASKNNYGNYDVTSLTTNEQAANHESDIQHFVSSDDGSLLLLNIGNDELKLWDNKQNKMLWQAHNQRGIVNNLAVSHDKKYGAVLITQPGVYELSENAKKFKPLTDALDILDLNTGKVIKSLPNFGEQVIHLHFKDDNTLQVGVASGKLFDWSLTTGNKTTVANFPENIIAIDSDHDRYAYVSKNGSVRVGDGQQHIHLSIENKNNPFKYAQLIDSGKKLLTVLASGDLSLWNVESGEKMLRLFSSKQGWTVMDEFSRFDGSEDAMENFSWLANEENIPLDHFSENYYEPGLLSNVIQNQDYLNNAPDKVTQGISLPPKVELHLSEQQSKGDKVAVQMDVYNRGGGIDKVNIYHNGKIINNEKTQLEDNAEHLASTLNIIPTAGKNTLKVVASNDMGIENSSTELSFDGKTKAYSSAVRLLTVGINQYSDQQLNLLYSVADANSIGQALTNQSKIAASEHLTNNKATKAGILAELRKLSQGIQQDVLVIYFAGHGIAVDKEWYFLPHETKLKPTPEQIAASGITATELGNIFKDSKIQHIMLMVDSCYSGAGIDAFKFKKQQNNQRYFARKMSRTMGITVIAATAKDQEASELNSLGHGLFTYAIMQELQKKDTSTLLSAHGIAESITKTLPVFSKKMLGFTQDPVVYTKGDDFMLTDLNKDKK
jgi:filamentous hemagglutinin family protein